MLVVRPFQSNLSSAELPQMLRRRIGQRVRAIDPGFEMCLEGAVNRIGDQILATVVVAERRTGHVRRCFRRSGPAGRWQEFVSGFVSEIVAGLGTAPNAVKPALVGGDGLEPPTLSV